MKNFFTYGFFLLFLIGIGNNVKAATITALPHNLLTDGVWGTATNWDSGTVPTYADDVIIPAGDSINLQASAYCQNITINGTIYSVNGGLTANGNITVNKGGSMAIKSNFQCTNMYNYGRVWCWNTNGTGSPKALYVGYTYNGTTTAGSGDYVLLNDSVFGDNRKNAITTSTIAGSGINVIFSNLCKSLTIKTSGKTSGYFFTIGGIFPDVKTPVAQDLNLNIQESMVLLKSGSQPCFSLINTSPDAFTGFNRTCTISANDTVFINGVFHMKSNSAPTANVGNMTYNVYGCLDLGSFKDSFSSSNELDLLTTSFSGSTSSLIMNVGDGTTVNPGTLVLGKTTNLTKSSTGQTLQINTSRYSTVQFGCTTNNNTVNTTNISLPAFNNLSIATNTYNVILPATSPSTLRVNALTLTSGKVTLGNNNITAGTISGGSSSSYIITSGTGVLSLNANPVTGTLFPIGTATGYAPVTITPANNDTISALVSAVPTGAFTGYSVNSNEWTLTPQIATTATLALTPTTAANTNSPVAIFSGVASGSYTTATTATLSGSTYSASGISLPVVATQFATGGSTVATAIESNTNKSLLIYSANNSLVVRNATVGNLVTVYGISGVKVASAVVKDNVTSMTLTPGIYIVKAGSTVQKVSVQ